eukprot:g16315.t1
MEQGTSGDFDAAWVRRAATESDGRAIFHLVRKCDDCREYSRHVKQCFNKGHELVIRTVRVSENGAALEDVDSGEVLSKTNEGDKFYHMLKPASRVFAWNKRGEKWEVPWASLEDRKSLAIAEGTMLLRSVPPKAVIVWLTSPHHMVEDHPFPARVVSRVALTSPRRSPGYMYLEEDSATEAGEVGGGESADQASRKRTEPSPAVGAGGGDGDEQRQQQEKGESRKPAKRRASTRPGAGVRVSPVGSGGKLGEVYGPGTDSGAPLMIKTTNEVPSTPTPTTKEEVQQVLTGKLRACEKRELELKAVIEKATAELRKNSECRKAAVAESERQLLSIIAQREAKAAHYEQLAAQARAQNTSDRESLQAHKEKIQKEVAEKDLVVTAVAEAAYKADAAAASTAEASHNVVETRDTQAAANDPARPGKGTLQFQKNRVTGRVALSSAGVTGSPSWSIGAQAALLAQARSAQAQLAQPPQSVRAPAQTVTAVHASSPPPAAAERAATTSADGSPSQPLPEEHKKRFEEEKARAREKILLAEQYLRQLENKGTGAASSPAAAVSDTTDAQPLLPAAPAPAVVRPTASPPAGLLAADKTITDVSAGMAKTTSVQALFSTGTATLDSASASATEASPAVPSPTVTPSNNPPSDDSATVDVSRAVITAAAHAGARSSSPPAATAVPVTYIRVGQQVVSPGGHRRRHDIDSRNDRRHGDSSSSNANIASLGYNREQ